LSVSARLVLLESFPAFLLSVPLKLAEVAVLPVVVGIVSSPESSSPVGCGSCLVASSAYVVTSSSSLEVIFARLRSGSSFIKSCNIVVVVFHFSGVFLLLDFVD
jgi:hypothetical protein